VAERAEFWRLVGYNTVAIEAAFLILLPVVALFGSAVPEWTAIILIPLAFPIGLFYYVHYVVSVNAIVVSDMDLISFGFEPRRVLLLLAGTTIVSFIYAVILTPHVNRVMMWLWRRLRGSRT